MKKGSNSPYIIVAIGFLFVTFSFYAYQIIFTANILVGKKDQLVLIEKGESFKHFADRLGKEGVIHNPIYFGFVSKLMKYQDNVKPGLYMLKANMNNVEAVRLLRSGEQVPVKVTFNNIRFKNQLAGVFAEQLSCDSVKLDSMLNDKAFIESFGFGEADILSMFIPNTYQFLWTNDEQDVFKRMQREYKSFWNDKRLAQAAQIGLSPKEVSVLASIVEEETKHNDEKPVVAGVYLNRIWKDWPLQADPTVKYALNDPTRKRILLKDLEIDSPYNTYKYKGLPPGPLRCPEISSIDAVLNYKKHDYMYFCAKPDYSGYHAFAKTGGEHEQNRVKYQRFLRSEGIYR